MSPVQCSQGLGKLLIMGYFFVIRLSTSGFFPQVSLKIWGKDIEHLCYFTRMAGVLPCIIPHGLSILNIEVGQGLRLWLNWDSLPLLSVTPRHSLCPCCGSCSPVVHNLSPVIYLTPEVNIKRVLYQVPWSGSRKQRTLNKCSDVRGCLTSQNDEFSS